MIQFNTILIILVHITTNIFDVNSLSYQQKNQSRTIILSKVKNLETFRSNNQSHKINDISYESVCDNNASCYFIF